MDNWVSVAWYLPGVTWDSYRAMTLTDRKLLARSLNRYIKRRESLTGQPAKDRKL
jgi:hypothetical protein